MEILEDSESQISAQLACLSKEVGPIHQSIGVITKNGAWSTEISQVTSQAGVAKLTLSALGVVLRFLLQYTVRWRRLSIPL